MQGQGGILLEHLKKAHLHCDLAPGDRFFWFTTTGWMMWNFLVGGLLAGAAIVLYDGQPDPERLWEFAREAEVTTFGTSAGFIGACDEGGGHAAAFAGAAEHRLDRVAAAGRRASSGSTSRFPDVWLFSTSGGTDLCTAFVGACPLLPVYAGELQARCLGAAVEAWSEDGGPLVDEVGELVITSRCRRCRSTSGTTRTASATAPATSRCSPASGGTGTGSRSPSAARR